MLRYKIALTLLAPIVLLAVFLDQVRKKRPISDLFERLGLDLVFKPKSQPKLNRKRIWIHGASNGELLGAKRLIEDILNRSKDVDIFVTTNSASAKDLVTSWGLQRVTPRLAPLDYGLCLNLFLSETRPTLALSIENEIWPNRFAKLDKSGIPLIVIGARISDKSAKNWRKFRTIFGGTLDVCMTAIKWVAAQDAESEQNLMSLGMSEEKLLPKMNLKSSVSLLPAEAEKLAALRPHFDRDKTILAVSTHEGEDDIILDAFRQLREQGSNCKLILAPRHPARGGAIAQMIEANGFSVARRSEGAAPDTGEIYLVDTLGETALCYQLSGLCLVGGSFVEKGGHTPFEPAQFKCAILHGPHTENHQLSYTVLSEASAACNLSTADTLADELRRLLENPAQARALGAKGDEVLDQLRTANLVNPAFWEKLSIALSLPSLSQSQAQP